MEEEGHGDKNEDEEAHDHTNGVPKGFHIKSSVYS